MTLREPNQADKQRRAWVPLVLFAAIPIVAAGGLKLANRHDESVSLLIVIAAIAAHLVVMAQWGSVLALIGGSSVAGVTTGCLALLQSLRGNFASEDLWIGAGIGVAVTFLSIACGAPFWALADARERRERRSHESRFCPSCVYDLRGLPHTAQCPECGAARAGTERRVEAGP